MSKEVYVLDSCALIAYLRNEEGILNLIETFKKAIEKSCVINIHSASVAEVYYDSLRVSGKIKADRILKDLDSLPLIRLNSLSITFIRKIGYFKVNHKVSFADCIILALASVKKAIVISSDHHEFDAIKKTKDLSFHWIR